MKSIQIGSAACAPVSPLPSGFFSSYPTHTPTDDVGVEADEPRVGELVHRARLAGQRPLERLGGKRGAALHDALEQMRHQERGVGAQRLARLGAVLLEMVPSRSETERTAKGVIRTPWLGKAE